MISSAAQTGHCLAYKSDYVDSLHIVRVCRLLFLSYMQRVSIMTEVNSFKNDSNGTIAPGAFSCGLNL